MSSEVACATLDCSHDLITEHKVTYEFVDIGTSWLGFRHWTAGTASVGACRVCSCPQGLLDESQITV